MPSISFRAIDNNKNLFGSEINLRESICSFCATYVPYTDEKLTAIADRIGMDIGQASSVLKELISKGEVARHNGKIYLLRLDDWQLEKIAVNNFKLLETLGELGCKEAKKLVESLTKKVETNSTDTTFLLQFFLFNQLSLSQEQLSSSQTEVESISSLNETNSTALKDKNVLSNVSQNVCVNGGKEGKTPPSFPLSANGQNFQSAGDSDEPRNENRSPENPKTEEPLGGEGKNGKNGKSVTQEPRGGESYGSGKQAKKDEIRRDIAQHLDWIKWLEEQPENQGINVRGLYRKMTKECKEKGDSVTRERFVRWLAVERRGIPMALELPEEENKDGTGGKPGSGAGSGNDKHLQPRRIGGR
jgi:ribosomal protein L7/L12